MTDSTLNPIKFGEQTRLDSYLLEPESVYINHGSYGPCPKVVYEELLQLRQLQERNPDRWFRYIKPDLYLDCIKAAANYVNCDAEKLVLIENATFGINAVLKSDLPFMKNGGSILCTTLAYGSVRHTVEQAAIQHGMQVYTLDVRLPITKQQLLDLFESTIEKCKQSSAPIRFAVFDHIASATAILLPIEELTEICQYHSIPVLIDGAHGPGQIFPALSMSKLHCDFYTGNFHKWSYAARGCAFLFIRDSEMANLIRPAVTSWGYHPSIEWNMSHLHVQFLNQGTRDESSLFTLPRALKFLQIDCAGLERIHAYNSNLSAQAKQYLEERFHTQNCDLFDEDLQAPCMKLVKLPDLREYKKTEVDALRLLMDLMANDNIVTAILCIQNELYVRISTQIFNTLKDYEVFAEKILTLAV